MSSTPGYEENGGPSRKRQRNEEEERRPREDTQVYIVPSLFGIDARNDFTRTIGDFILNTSRGHENVEVGA
jgi:hypothetical protein